METFRRAANGRRALARSRERFIAIVTRGCQKLFSSGALVLAARCYKSCAALLVAVPARRPLSRAGDVVGIILYTSCVSGAITARGAARLVAVTTANRCGSAWFRANVIRRDTSATRKLQQPSLSCAGMSFIGKGIDKYCYCCCCCYCWCYYCCCRCRR